MKADEVTATLEMALDASGLDKATARQRPRPLSDNGSSYISDDLAKWLERHDMAHVRGAPYHPMTQGKIERWHQTLKNRILLENYYLPGDLEAQIEAFVADYNYRRYHESISNLTPAVLLAAHRRRASAESGRKAARARRKRRERHGADPSADRGFLILVSTFAPQTSLRFRGRSRVHSTKTGMGA